MIHPKKLIVFDLDGTLAESKQSITPEVAKLLRNLLQLYEVAVISGAEFERFQAQLIQPLDAEDIEIANLHIMPTNGTSYYRYDLDLGEWRQIYASEIETADKERITSAIKNRAQELGFWEANTWGEIVEDRGSQITFSALGQRAPLEEKRKWDPDNKKKRQLQQSLAADLPDYAVHYAGMTSIDVTIKGQDKASSILKLKEMLGFKSEEVVFVGDALKTGGNDAVVKEAGLATIEVRNPTETQRVITGFLA